MNLVTIKTTITTKEQGRIIEVYTEKTGIVTIRCGSPDHAGWANLNEDEIKALANTLLAFITS